MKQMDRTTHATDADLEWSPQSLIAIVPIVATSFAFAFVVGYFSAFDIAWFPFFSLPEHTVFALRALPVAIGASAFFLIALVRPIHKRWHLPLTVFWITVLALAGYISFFQSHPAFALTFLLVAYGTIVHYREGPPQTSFKRILFWAITLMAMSLIAGWVSATSWKGEWYLNKSLSLSLPLPPLMCVQSKTNNLQGHVVFVGNQGILFYDYRTKKTTLLKPDDVQTLFQPKYQIRGPLQRFWRRDDNQPRCDFQTTIAEGPRKGDQSNEITD